MNHRLRTLPTIGLENLPGQSVMAKLEIDYPCSCGEVVRAAVIQPTEAWTDATDVSYQVADLGRRARELWAGHIRGEA